MHIPDRQTDRRLAMSAPFRGSKSVGLVQMGKFVTSCLFNSLHCGKVPTIFLLIDRERLPVLVHASAKPGFLNIAQRSRAEVEAARAEPVRHLGELVVGELLDNRKILAVVQVCLRA